jgi:hypothetical protein
MLLGTIWNLNRQTFLFVISLIAVRRPLAFETAIAAD